MTNRNRPAPGGGWGIIVPFFIAAIIFIWPSAVWHGCKYGETTCGAASEWVWNGSTWIAQAIWWAILLPTTVFVGYGIYRGRHPIAPPPFLPPLSVPREPEPPGPPPCLHRNAVRVENLTDPDLPPWAYLCPDCDEQLDESFGRLMRSCCGTPPGTGHARNCPQAAEWAP